MTWVEWGRKGQKSSSGRSHLGFIELSYLEDSDDDTWRSDDQLNHISVARVSHTLVQSWEFCWNLFIYLIFGKQICWILMLVLLLLFRFKVCYRSPNLEAGSPTLRWSHQSRPAMSYPMWQLHRFIISVMWYTNIKINPLGK